MTTTEALSWQSALSRIGVVLLLVIVNGFFVAIEFALVAARVSRLRERAAAGNALAAAAESLVHKLDAAIAAAQLGITIASLLVGWLGESTMAALFLVLLDPFLPHQAAIVTSHSVAVALAFASITLLHVVIGEQIPKSVAILHPNRTAMYLSRPMQFAMLILKPFVWLLTWATNLGLRMVGLPPPKAHQMVHTVEELKHIIDASHTGGALDTMEKDLLQKVFKFGDLVARQVMVPRTEMASIPGDASIETVVLLSGKTGHTRFPIYDNDVDNIIGVLHMKDIVFFLQTKQPFDLKKIMKEAHFVPEAMPIVQLLTDFKQKHTQMAIVVDEFGGTSGLVTLEDVIEEIIGDFYDEHHPAVREIIRVADDELIMHAGVRLDEINERFNLKLKSEEADTIGGYVLQELGQIPRIGETLEVPGASLKVEDISGTRIKIIRLKLLPQPITSD